MCGRFTLTEEIKAIRDHFAAVNQVEFTASYNISPSHEIPAVRLTDDNKKEIFLCHWGLIPHWSKPDSKYKAINARAETLADKPFFRDAFRHRRCLIPANGFYEWKKQNGSKQPYYFNIEDSPIFAFAGLWEYWQGDKQAVESSTIVTTAANKFMSSYHERMPVILNPDNYDEWLETGDKNLLVPYQGEMECYPVSKYVNNPKNNGKDLIQPVTVKSEK